MPKATLKRNLGLWAIVGLGLGYMTPTVVFDTFGLVAEESNNVVPMAYVAALVVMLFTAISYGKMAGAFRPRVPRTHTPKNRSTPTSDSSSVGRR